MPQGIPPSGITTGMDEFRSAKINLNQDGPPNDSVAFPQGIHVISNRFPFRLCHPRGKGVGNYRMRSNSNKFPAISAEWSPLQANRESVCAPEPPVTGEWRHPCCDSFPA
jgi:hypothetical protein